jgi:hypothetical protein
MNLLDIDAPVIGAVNGPAHFHAEVIRAVGHRARGRITRASRTSHTIHPALCPATAPMCRMADAAQAQPWSKADCAARTLAGFLT